MYVTQLLNDMLYLITYCLDFHECNFLSHLFVHIDNVRSVMRYFENILIESKKRNIKVY